MYAIQYDYVKPKYKKKDTKLLYMDTDSFIVYRQTKSIYPEITKDVETRFYTSKDELDKSLPKGKNKNIIVLTKDELGGKITKNFAEFRPKTQSYLTDINHEDKKKAKSK